MYTIVIGKAFNVADVGYYNRANSFAFLPSSIFGQVVNRVMFPLLSENQDDDEVLLTKYSRVLRISMYIYVPIMVALAALSKPIILLLIGEKWIKCLPLMQVLCLGYVFSPLSTLNLNLLYAKGRSDLSLKLDLIKKSIGVLLLLVSIPLGLWLMCVGKALYDFIAFVMNCYYTKKLLNYSFIKQFSDLWIIFVSSTLMFFIIILLSFCFESIWMQLFVGVASGITSYLILTYSLKEPALKEIIEFCVNKRRTT